MIPIAGPEVFPVDIEKLLQPFPGASPCGESLRYEGTFDRIREARRYDDPGMDQGVWQTDLKKADWSAVEALCLDALKTRSKDLQIAAWLLEAWLHLYGFAGVREGLRLQTSLCERFWDTVHPRIEDGDCEFRIGPIHWLNEKVSVQLKLIQITRPQGLDDASYCVADWENACRLASDGVKRPATQLERYVTQAKFQHSAGLTPTLFFLNLSQDLESVRRAGEDLETLLDEKLGKAAPSLRHFQGIIQSLHGLIVGVFAQNEPTSGLVRLAEATEPDSPLEPAGLTVSGNGRIRSRAEAYRRLAEAADYLVEAEPHSPAPYLVRRAIAWGGMRLDELLVELVRNDSELSDIFRLLQMTSPRNSTR